MEHVWHPAYPGEALAARGPGGRPRRARLGRGGARLRLLRPAPALQGGRGSHRRLPAAPRPGGAPPRRRPAAGRGLRRRLARPRRRRRPDPPRPRGPDAGSVPGLPRRLRHRGGAVPPLPAFGLDRARPERPAAGADPGDPVRDQPRGRARPPRLAPDLSGPLTPATLAGAQVPGTPSTSPLAPEAAARRLALPRKPRGHRAARIECRPSTPPCRPIPSRPLEVMTMRYHLAAMALRGFSSTAATRYAYRKLGNLTARSAARQHDPLQILRADPALRRGAAAARHRPAGPRGAGDRHRLGPLGIAHAAQPGRGRRAALRRLGQPQLPEVPQPMPGS